MGCGVVERYLEMAKPTNKKNTKVGRTVLKGFSRPLFLYFRRFYSKHRVHIFHKEKVLIAGFKPESSVVGSSHSANCATTTTRVKHFYNVVKVAIRNGVS